MEKLVIFHFRSKADYREDILILCKLRKVIREWREDIFTATSAYPGLGQCHSPLNGMLLLVTSRGLGKERDCLQPNHEIYSQYTHKYVFREKQVTSGKLHGIPR